MERLFWTFVTSYGIDYLFWKVRMPGQRYVPDHVVIAQAAIVWWLIMSVLSGLEE